MMPPLAEYLVLHTYLLGGGDHWATLVHWVYFLGSLVGVSLVARQLGAGRRGQTLAPLFAATLPSGILQASSAKNEWVLTFWLVALVYFGARFTQRPARADLIGMGLIKAT